MTTLAAPDAASPATALVPRRGQLLLAFGIVYVVWGSTYLAMRIAIEQIPPFLMGGARFLTAGLLLGAWAAWREGLRWPSARTWGWAAATGGLLFIGGNGGVAWAERTVPSGVVALLAASLAIWMVLFDWLRTDGQRPTALVFAGVAMGMGGVALLVGPGALAGAGGIDPWGATLVLGGSLAWAAGSLLSRHAAAPDSPILGSALQMLTGGAFLLGLAAMHGDFADVDRWIDGPGAARALWAMAYLIVFGSLVAFTAYVWLMRHAAPSKVATYAYVNPVVAVLLGWAVGGEAIGPRTVAASAVIVAAVALITTGRARTPR